MSSNKILDTMWDDNPIDITQEANFIWSIANKLFFSLDVFRSCVDKLLWIESAAAIGSVASCVFWGLHRKYARWSASVKANVKSGAFVMKEDRT